MSDWQGYVMLENLALSVADWASFRTAMQALGPGSDPQPSHLCHYRLGRDSEREFYEALFDDANLTVAAFKSRLATVLSVAVGTISSDEQYVLYDDFRSFKVVLIQDSIDRVRYEIFYPDANTWLTSHSECRAYIDLRLWEWAPTEISATYNTYYVDATAGDDAKDGLSIANAWKTIAKVNGEAFNAGDSVLFARGEVWRDDLILPSSGASGEPITWGVYGEGAKPLLTGADLVATWAADEVTETWGENSGDDNNGVTEDTYIRGGASSAINYNAQNRIFAKDYDADGDFSRKGFILFDLSGGVGTVTAATLYLKADTGGEHDEGIDTDLKLCTRAWVEATATWDDYDGVNPWGANHDESTQLVNFNSVADDDWENLTSAAFLTAAQNAWGSGDLNLTVTTDVGSNVRYLASGVADGSRPYVSITTGTPDVWKATLVTEPDQVFFDGVKGQKKGSVAACTDPRDWFWAANVLYVYSSGGDPDTEYTDPGIEASARRWCINLNGQDYITIDGLASGYNNNLSLEERGAIEYYSAAQKNLNDITIKDCTFDYAAAHGIRINLAHASSTLDGLRIYQNAFTNIGIDDLGYGAQIWSTAVNCYTNFEFFSNVSTYCQQEMICLRADNGGQIYLNASTHDGHGVSVDSGAILIGNNCTGTEVHHNILIDADVDPIWLGTTNISGIQIHRNIVDGTTTSYGMYLDSGCDDIDIYNNVIYAATGGFSIGHNGQCTNIDIRNNIVDALSPDAGQTNVDSENASTFTDIDHNCWDESRNFTIDAVVKNWAQWQGLGYDANGFHEDCKMTDPANDDFTLQVTSPCRDAGEDVSLTHDFEYVIVPQETDPAIGAYEYVP